MRKFPTQLIKAIPLILLMLAFIGVNAQRRYSPLANTDLTITILNQTSTSNTLEFDVYYLDTDAAQDFEVANTQIGVVLNSGVYNGGTVTAQLLAGTSEMNASQIPTSITYFMTQNCMKVAPKNASGAGAGTVISKVAPGTRLGRFRFTNTANWTAISYANLLFSFTTTPYPTKCYEYISAISTQVSTTAVNCTNGTGNPVLNGAVAPIAYNVGGSGSYCEGGNGLSVILSNSENGVTYTLYKNTVAQVPTQTGVTGSALTWANQTAGSYTISGNNIAGTTVMTGSAVISMNSNCSFSWVGGVSSDWFNPANWSGNIVPLATNAITIPFPSANYPVIAGAVTAVCAAGTIQTGATITVSGKFSPAGALTFNGTEALIINDGGSFIDNGLPGTGTAKVLKAMGVSKWHYISSPIADGKSAIFTGDWLSTYSSQYANGWLAYNYIIDPNVALVPEKGYAAYILSSHSAPKVFSGHLNTNAAAIACIPQSIPTAGTGFNLVGNAYASAIDLTNANITWPSASHTVYFWDPINQTYKVYALVNPTHSQFAPAIQSFFIEAPAAGNFQVPNAARVHNAEAFVKDAGNYANVLEINATSQANGMVDLAVVGFVPGTTTGYDFNYDAAKLAGGTETPQIYSLLQDNQKVAYNIQPSVNANTVVPMGFTCGVNGSFTLNASNLTSFDASARIYLEDLKEGTIQDLKANPDYTFEYAAGDAANRFVLHFSNITGINDQHANGVQVYSYEASLYIKNLDNQSLKNVFVYDLLGKEVFQSALNTSPLQKFVLSLTQGYYVVKVVSATGVTTQKVYFN